MRSLCREHKLTQAEVGKALRRDKSWVCRRLMLAERLEDVLQDDIRLGLLSSTVARELARLPRGNQVAMATAIRAHGLTSKQAHRIVTELPAYSGSGGARRSARRTRCATSAPPSCRRRAATTRAWANVRTRSAESLLSGRHRERALRADGRAVRASGAYRRRRADPGAARRAHAALDGETTALLERLAKDSGRCDERRAAAAGLRGRARARCAASPTRDRACARHRAAHGEEDPRDARTCAAPRARARSIASCRHVARRASRSSTPSTTRSPRGSSSIRT